MASFMPFLDQINDMENYYASYYGAVSSLEQGLLASKQVNKRENKGTTTNSQKIKNFFDTGKANKVKRSRLSEMTRKINSRTKEIADNNINYLYGGNSSNKKSKLDYNKVVAITLNPDNNTPTDINSTFEIPSWINDKDLKNLLKSWDSNKEEINKNGIHIVKQDGVFYLWIDENFRTTDNKKIPLLEFLLKTNNNREVGDKKFDIKGIGTAKDYTVELEIEKPTKDILSPGFKKTLFPTKKLKQTEK